MVAASQQRLAGRGAQRADVEPVVGQPTGRQAVGGRRRARTAERVHRRKTRIVQQDHQHIGRALGRPQRLDRRETRLRVLGVIGHQPGERAIRDRQHAPILRGTPGTGRAPIRSGSTAIRLDPAAGLGTRPHAVTVSVTVRESPHDRPPYPPAAGTTGVRRCLDLIPDFAPPESPARAFRPRSDYMGDGTRHVAALDVGDADHELGQGLPQHPLTVRAVLPCGLEHLVRVECQAPVRN